MFISEPASFGQKNCAPKAQIRDLFDVARERAQVANPAIARLVRRHRLTIPHAAVIAELSGFGGARNG